MRLWLSRNGEATLQSQLVTQIRLGVLSGDLQAGEQLPSIRALARRLRVHSNTVRAAYLELGREGIVRTQRGRGSFVAAQTEPARSWTLSQMLDDHVASLFEFALSNRLRPEALQNAIDRYLKRKTPGHFLLVESDAPLRQIVLHELESFLSQPVRWCAMEDLERTRAWVGSVVLVLPSKAGALRSIVAPQTESYTMKLQSIPEALAKYLPAPEDSLIAIASAWPRFLEEASTMLLAAGIASESLIVVKTGTPRWQKRIQPADFLVCDAYTASIVDDGPRQLVFRLLSDAMRKKLITREKQFTPSARL